MTAAATLEGFESVYRKHVEMVRSGDLKGVMADMDPAAGSTVFAGVTVPQGRVDAADIRAIRLEDGRAVGECAYTTEVGTIGLCSGWRHDGTTWLADSLANFEA